MLYNFTLKAVENEHRCKKKNLNAEKVPKNIARVRSRSSIVSAVLD